MRQTIGYVRVSTVDQATNGLSLEAQTERLKAYAVATGRELTRVVVDDGRSASSLERPGIRTILSDIRAGQVEAVIIMKLDRLTRSVRDLADLVELFSHHNVDLVSVTESLDTGSASGRMVMNIMATVGQWEREIIGERTATVLGHMRETGRVYGKTPMGYRREGDRLVEDPTEQMALISMRSWRAEGDSYLAIAHKLNQHQVPPRQGGKKWYAASVQKVLSSQMARAAG